MKEISYSSSLKSQIPTIIAILLGMILLLSIAIVSNHYVQEVYTETDTSGFLEFVDLKTGHGLNMSYEERNDYWMFIEYEDQFFWSQAARLFSLIILLFLVLPLLEVVYANPKDYIELIIGDKSIPSKIRVHRHNFPKGRSTDGYIIDRVLGCRVFQDGTDGLLNVGDVRVNVVVFVNNKHHTNTEYLKGVKDPHKIQELIEKEFVNHEGFELKVNNAV